MKGLWYVLVILLGAMGALAALRGAERLIFGAAIGSAAVQLGLGALFLLLAWKSLAKARSTSG
jgi:hypothetical protein